MLVDLSDLPLHAIEKKLEHAVFEPTFSMLANVDINLSYNPHVDGTIVEEITGMPQLLNRRISINLSNTGVSPTDLVQLVKNEALDRLVAMGIGLSTEDAIKIVIGALESSRSRRLSIDLRWNSIDLNYIKKLFRNDTVVEIFAESGTDIEASILVRIGSHTLKQVRPLRLPLADEEWSTEKDHTFDVRLETEIGISWKHLKAGRPSAFESSADSAIFSIPEKILKAALEKAVGCSRSDSEVPALQIKKFGSSVNGFGSKTSDVDLVVCATEERGRMWFSENFSSVEKQRSLAQDFLYNLRLMVPGEVETELVLHARVPVLKLFRFGSQSLSLDITFMNTVCLRNSRLLKSYACLDESLFRLGHMVKIWARNNELISSLANNHAFPNSYAWTLLCIFFCQTRLSGCVSLLTPAENYNSVWGCKSSFFVDEECSDPFTAKKDQLLRLPRSPLHIFILFLNFIAHEADNMVIDLRGVTDQNDLPIKVVDPIEISRVVTRNVEPDNWDYVKRIASLYIARLESAKNHTDFFSTAFGKYFAV